jgi:tripartite-type tricarboxylate transporter receptor subunit TctC
LFHASLVSLADRAVGHRPLHLGRAGPGLSILSGTNSTNAALKSLMKKLPYDQDTAFAPLGSMGSVPLIVAVNNDVSAKTLRELVALGKTKPGHITFASADTSQLVSSEMLAHIAGVEMTNVPYKSGPAAMTDLIGGQVGMFSAAFAVMLPQVKGGKVRGLAVTSAKRSAAVPELPTVNEALGLKDCELIAYFAMFAPAGTPPEIVAKAQSGDQRRGPEPGAAGKIRADRFRGRTRHGGGAGPAQPHGNGQMGQGDP